jgi:hypothetical protein
MGRTSVAKIRSLLELDWEVMVRHLYREGFEREEFGVSICLHNTISFYFCGT